MKRLLLLTVTLIICVTTWGQDVNSTSQHNRGSFINLSDISFVLVSGWNWIGYISSDPMPLQNALSSITPGNGDMIKSHSELAVYDSIAGVWNGELSILMPGHGYLYLHYGNPITLTYDGASDGTPSVLTAPVVEITEHSAFGGGMLMDDGGGDLTACGICWSTNPNPTIGDAHTVVNDFDSGIFIGNMTDLLPNTTYYVRAYASTSQMTIYGEEVSFTTLNNIIGVPEGAIDGKFTVNDEGDQIYFSKGNLQYIGSATTPYWKFAENQWDCFADNGQGDASQTIDRDLFGWGTSGCDHGANCYQPWSTSTANSDYYAYGSFNYNLYDQTGFADWGVYNPISNGLNLAGLWRTLTIDEWDYVLNLRDTPSGILFAKAKVNNVNGVVILPDNWSSDYYNLNNPNKIGSFYSSNVISSSDWTTSLEANGAVFLPAGGNRYGTMIADVGSDGFYWSSSCHNENNAKYLTFYNSSLALTYCSRYYGLSVRLVFPVMN